MRKVFRIQAGGTKRMKNVACWGGEESGEECNLGIKRETSFHAALRPEKHLRPPSPSQKRALCLHPTHTTCSES